MLNYFLYMARRALYYYCLLPSFTPLGKRFGKSEKGDLGITS
jgi:hypothetical protein